MKPLSSRQSLIFRATLLLGLLAALTNCKRSDDQITVYRIPKEAETPAMIPAPDAQTAAAPAEVHWTSPSDWTPQPASGFRKASYLIHGPNGQSADVSVISFPQSAGGVLANVNRWRNQLKLAPISDAVQAATPISVDGRDMFFVDLVSDQPLEKDGAKSRILGGIFPTSNETWFFKMTGPDPLVESQRVAFRKFLQSVHEKAEANTAAPAPAAAPSMTADQGGNATNAPTPPPIEAAQGGSLQYTLPAGWTEKPLTPMRLASFKATGANGKEVDISVVALPGMAGGDLANVNRWRGQMKLPPVSEDQLAKSAGHVQANGHDFLVVDLASTQTVDGQDERILAAILDETDRSWFIKMTGNAAAVEAEKSAFTEFLRGLKIP